LKAIDEIESVAVISKPLNFVGIIEHYCCGDIQIDTLNKYILSDYYEINKNILSTIGVEVAEGSPSIEELENMSFGYYDVILTETADRYYFPDHRGVNEKYLITDHELKYKVVGIIKDIRLVNTDRNTAYVIHNYNPRDIASNFIVRLKDGINTSEYVKDNRENLRNTAASGNYYVWDIISVTESNKEREAGQGLTASRNLRISLALLFLINLILGVIGTVWLQTRRRISEIGIYRTFGALKIDVRSMLIGENLVLSIAAIVIGLLLYFQYALKEGLFDSVKYPDGYIQNYSWVADFAPHFAIVSAIVAAIILLCVVIGTYIPAHKASDIEPVDALRDE
ncbi:MAG: FtsX-like permease family protein, partial [Muribaculaceae bacterium]|nr:FtsX-like permease family protein [Muribaculaceae bacterium]